MIRGAVLSLVFIGAAALSTAAGGPGETSWNFDRDAPGELPQEFEVQAGTWKVVESKGGNVLAQLAKNDDATFNLALLRDRPAGDVDLTVNLRPIDGELDRGGGLVWRARDARNYYVARYNPLEANFRVYKVENGKRTLFKSADVPPAKSKDARYSLHVSMIGDRIECRLDGGNTLDVRDSTFTGAGKIGLWTKADARTEFDDLTLKNP